MAWTKLKKRFLYVRAMPAEHDLASLLRQVRQARPEIAKRTEKIGDGPDERVRFVAKWRASGSTIGGAMVEYAPGHLPASVAIPAGATEVDVAPFSSKVSAAHEKYAHGLIHFVVRERHAAIFCHGNLRADQLSTHLDWLVRECAAVLPPASPPVYLEKRPHKAVLADYADVRTLTLRTTLGDVDSDRATPAGRPSKLRMEWISGLIGRGEAARLSAKDAEKLAEVEVEVTWKVDGRRRGGDTGIVGWLARHVEEEHLPKLRGTRRGGGELRGESLLLCATHEVPSDKGVPKFEGSLKQLNAWLDHLLENGSIL